MIESLLYQKDILSIADFSTAELEQVIHTALSLKKKPQHDLLTGRVIASCFFEPSTRTRLSFETAMLRLGAKVIGFADESNTSVKKGETLADTARIISNFADAIVMRHHKDGASRLVSEFARVPVLNAGDGTNQHPSQTLLDLVSIYETQGRLDGLKIALAGDLKYGRTVHSLAQAMCHFGCHFYFIAPDNLAMPDYICDQLKEAGISYDILPTLEDAIGLVDILYMTRIQRERIDEQEFLKIHHHFTLTAAMLEQAQPQLKVLHPLPRVGEIAADVDPTPYAYYFEQARNGLFVRQALLALVLNPTLEIDDE